jgi:hypothetical protein
MPDGIQKAKSRFGRSEVLVKTRDKMFDIVNREYMRTDLSVVIYCNVKNVIAKLSVCVSRVLPLRKTQHS